LINFNIDSFELYLLTILNGFFYDFHIFYYIKKNKLTLPTCIVTLWHQYKHHSHNVRCISQRSYEWHHYINPQQDLSFWSSYKLVIFQSLQIFFKHFGVTIVSINAIFLKILYLLTTWKKNSTKHSFFSPRLLLPWGAKLGILIWEGQIRENILEGVNFFIFKIKNLIY
jgi:hypothetical protein